MENELSYLKYTGFFFRIMNKSCQLNCNFQEKDEGIDDKA